MKQITIYDILHLLRKGWVAMDKNGDWCWYMRKPTPSFALNLWGGMQPTKLSFLFNIAPFDGDWKDSLMECMEC